MTTNLSKHSCCFSDFYHPATTPDFPGVSDVNAYLRQYAQKFKLENELRLNHRVLSLKPFENGWQVRFLDKSGKQREEQFQAVVVASGFFSTAVIPVIEGLSSFRNPVLHSSDYRSRENFAGKNVLVVGNGLSGVEISADLCGAASSVTHLIRRPAWIVPRYLNDPKALSPLPLDLVFYRRAAAGKEPVSQEEARRRRNRFLSRHSAQNELDAPELAIDPDSSEFVPVAISDRYVELFSKGALQVVRSEGIERFRHCSVITNEGLTLKPDVVIFATGYRFSLPFLDEDIKSKLLFEPADPLQPAILYQATCCRDLPQMAFTGTYKGPFFGAIELQARLAAALLSGRNEINNENYNAQIAKELEIRNGLPRPQFPRADYVGFCDSLAKELGCFPELDASDPLYQEVVSGPVIPAHYRLKGVGAKEELASSLIQDLNTCFFEKKI
jgi:dimethylaniline monooxygenase (N-oxide forming)